MPPWYWLAVLATICLAMAALSSGQVVGGSSQNNQVWISNLAPPVYPPLPRMARIMGDVVIRLEIRSDGSVASAEVVSGPPMLRQAALDSAQKSTFHCDSCGDKPITYMLTFTFGFREDSDCSLRRTRSLKCLYLWKCGPAYDSDQGRPAIVGRSSNRIMVLADLRCIETEHTGDSK
jgi:TonB family protein